MRDALEVQVIGFRFSRSRAIWKAYERDRKGRVTKISVWNLRSLSELFVERHLLSGGARLVTQGRRAEVAQLFSQPAFQPACQPAARVGQAAVHWSANKV